MGYNVQKLTVEELYHLIKTLEDDLANRPVAPEFEHDFVREMLEQTLARARARLEVLTNGTLSI